LDFWPTIDFVKMVSSSSSNVLTKLGFASTLAAITGAVVVFYQWKANRAQRKAVELARRLQEEQLRRERMQLVLYKAGLAAAATFLAVYSSYRIRNFFASLFQQPQVRRH
jgi:DMSO reductase anchor subunit